VPLKTIIKLAPLLEQLDELTVKRLTKIMSSFTPDQLEMSMRLMEKLQGKLDPVAELASLLNTNVVTSGTSSTPRVTHTTTSEKRAALIAGEPKIVTAAVVAPVASPKVAGQEERTPVRITMTNGSAPKTTTGPIGKQYMYHQAANKAEGSGRKLLQIIT
jgi:hypothetical protein